MKRPARRPVELVVIGASLGGLDALGVVLAALGPGFPPVAVAQHRSPQGESRLAHLLGRGLAVEVGEVEDKEPLSPGRVYLAPADYHLLVEEGRVALSTEAPVAFSRPSIDVLFESAARAYGPRVVGVLLTASSEDGAEGIAAVHRAGGSTVVQDPKTARSPVAPKAALRLTPGARVLPLEEIGPFLANEVAQAGGRGLKGVQGGAGRR
ncbi:MAG TPA: chemotaxis protein CheB [Thermoanaerobaculia bacterium]|nr:chemotaxis protein CheB [Thermoanaerobaculia bacterium]